MGRTGVDARAYIDDFVALLLFVVRLTSQGQSYIRFLRSTGRVLAPVASPQPGFRDRLPSSCWWPATFANEPFIIHPQEVTPVRTRPQDRTATACGQDRKIHRWLDRCHGHEKAHNVNLADLRYCFRVSSQHGSRTTTSCGASYKSGGWGRRSRIPKYKLGELLGTRPRSRSLYLSGGRSG